MTTETRHKIPWDIAFQAATEPCLLRPGAQLGGSGTTFLVYQDVATVSLSQMSSRAVVCVDVPDLSPLWHPGGKILVLSIPA